jgi:uncharacterized protein YukE
VAVELPGEVVAMLQFIGVNRPNVDEDKVREFASHVCEFADNVDGTHQKAVATVTNMASDYQGGSYDALVSSWAHLSSSHMSDLVSTCHTVATALEAAIGPLVAVVTKAVGGLAFKEVSGILGVDGKAGPGDGFVINPSALESHADAMAGHAQEVSDHAKALGGKLAAVDFTS